ncbi:2OG-Fe(II) oxygenase [Nonomuraea sp. LPB2021202275-12-8]|uniref:2OG-Fe(II) oxygenase n=1 Tax=Nonomuraea sp. LPB2021202275-12-8 TaxID=3120159 RepID=UPI00300CA964
MTFDVEQLLPSGWRRDISESAKNFSRIRILSGLHSSSREGLYPEPLPIHGVSGDVVAGRHAWVSDLYTGLFRALAEEVSGEVAICAREVRHAAVLNVAHDNGGRYECHVDTNPIEGLLFVTDHPRGSGGELVVSNSFDVNSPEEVDRYCSIIRPESGKLVLFDGRWNPHYVRPLISDPLRVVIAMNFYTSSCPEEARPVDLDPYLYGEGGKA